MAVFGAILIFLISIIIKQGIGFSYFQNNNLRATRLALKMSYDYSEGLKIGDCHGERCGEGLSSRNSASVLLIEDRLTAESAKYGAIDRTPQISMGSGLHTRNLFQDFDRNEHWNVPVADFFINGQHFPFTTAKLKTICLTRITDECPDYNGDTHHDARDYDEWYGATENYGDSNWKSDCSQEDNGDPHGCMRFYRPTANHPANLEWCNADALPGVLCPASCDSSLFPGCNLSVDKRFDLNRNDGIADVPLAPLNERIDFSWQWFMVYAFREEYLDDKEVKYPDAQINGAEGIILHDLTTKNTSLDVDSDLKEETIISLYPTNRYGGIEGMQVIDYQEGDLDFTLNDSDAKPAAGLTEETQMYSFVRGYQTDRDECGEIVCDPAVDPRCDQRCGTYLLIEEGKLFDSDHQFVRSAQKKDQIDIISRVIQLSNDTDRFCDENTVPTATVDGFPNPVEICCNKGTKCFYGDGRQVGSTCAESDPLNDIYNISKTCMYEGNLEHKDEDGNPDPKYPKIYVRSKVVDLHGRKWVTDVSQDTKPFKD